MIIRTTTRSFLFTESPNVFKKLPLNLIWNTASTWIGISPVLFGTMGATTDFASLGCKSTEPIKADWPFAAMEQWSLSPLIYNFAWVNTKKKKILCELMYLTKYATGAEMIPRRWKISNKPLSHSRHFWCETRLDGHKKCTQNKLWILKMACALFNRVSNRKCQVHDKGL